MQNYSEIYSQQNNFDKNNFGNYMNTDKTQKSSQNILIIGQDSYGSGGIDS